MASFQQLQRQLTAHIRNPDGAAAPAGIEPRRLAVYRDLIFNNIESFLSGGFPVLRSLYSEERWQALVRDFIVRHQCHSPYFPELSQEFLLYLQQTRQARPEDPPFLLELAHYEWVELALDIAEDDLALIAADRDGDLLAELPLVSPLLWSLCYQYPVHLIGPGYQPSAPPEQATYLLVYRDRADEVQFMQSNAVTARLLELLQGASQRSGEQALLALADEMQHPQPRQIVASGLEILQQLRDRDIILGTR